MTSNRFRVLHTDPGNLGEPLDIEAAELAKVGAEQVDEWERPVIELCRSPDLSVAALEDLFKRPRPSL